MAVQISKKRKVRAASRVAAASGRLHIGGAAMREVSAFVGGGGWRRLGEDGGGWRRMRRGGPVGKMAAGGWRGAERREGSRAWGFQGGRFYFSPYFCVRRGAARLRAGSGVNLA